MTSVPEQFSADQQSITLFVKFVAAKNGNGELPMALNADATANTFYSAADGNHVYATGGCDSGRFRKWPLLPVTEER